MVIATIALANLFFSRTTGGYFDSVSDEMPLLHTWSLSVEEQFYFVWPLLLVLLFKVRSKRLDSLALKVLFGVSVISLALSQWFIHTGKAQYSFYYMPLRSWELAAGGMIAFLLPMLHHRAPGKKVIEAGSWIGLLLVVLPMSLYSAQTPFPGFTAIPPVLGASLLIILGSFSYKSLVSRFLSFKPFAFIGLLSYGMYLWHWPLLAIAKIDQLGEIPTLPVRWGSLVLSTALAYVSLRLVERPFQQAKLVKNAAPWKILMCGIASMVAICGVWKLSSIFATTQSSLKRAWVSC